MQSGLSFIIQQLHQPFVDQNVLNYYSNKKYSEYCNQQYLKSPSSKQQKIVRKSPIKSFNSPKRIQPLGQKTLNVISGPAPMMKYTILKPKVSLLRTTVADLHQTVQKLEHKHFELDANCAQAIFSMHTDCCRKNADLESKLKEISDIKAEVKGFKQDLILLLNIIEKNNKEMHKEQYQVLKVEGKSKFLKDR